MRSALALLALMLIPAALSAESLAAASEREAERRKSVKAGEEKVFTEDDLHDNKGALANNPSATPGEKPRPDSDGFTVPHPNSPNSALASPNVRRPRVVTSDPEPESAEKQWKQRAQRARSTIREAEAALKAAEAKVAPLKGVRCTGAGPVGDDACNRQLAAIAELEREEKDARRTLADAKAAFDALEEEARRGGVPPGWLRE